jgi:hypothetical protein
LGAQRGLHAVAVQYLPLDLGSLDRLLADEVDLQGLLVFGADMPVGADELARLPQEVLLQSSDLAAGYRRGESPYPIERSAKWVEDNSIPQNLHF